MMELRNVVMEIRSVDEQARTMTGVVAPYNETTLLVADPMGERIMRHAFARSIAQRGNRIPLCINHQHDNIVGMSREWQDTEDELIGLFGFRNDAYGERAASDVVGGYMQSLSAGFLPVDRKRANDGVMEVREGRLVEVSLVIMGAYDGAQVLAARMAQQTADLLAPFQNPPAVPVPFAAPWC